MAELSDVYGQNYQDDAKVSKNNHIINTVANNIGHRQFNFRLFDSDNLWEHQSNLSPKIINEIIEKVKNVNNKMYLVHIDKNSEAINMLPELIVDTPVEYFWIIDADNNRAYYIYITPYQVCAY